LDDSGQQNTFLDQLIEKVGFRKKKKLSASSKEADKELHRLSSKMKHAISDFTNRPVPNMPA